MIFNISKNDCCGCTACASLCPKDAIDMKCDEEGFLYPQIVSEKCIDCGICNQVCAFRKVSQGKSIEADSVSSYVVKHNNNEVLFDSTSGGMFTALSDEIFRVGGVVYGAVFNDAFEVQHIRAESKIDRDRMRGSKYVQSDLREIFKCAEKDLKEGRQVLFTGTACQVDGLKSFLGGKYNNILFCDLICFGVSSPYIWKEYCRNLQKRYGKLKEYNFRPKNWGYNSSKTQAVFESDKKLSNFNIGLYKELYYSRLIMRPSCYSCPYTNLNRISDITIGDCRQAEKLFPEFGNGGASLVLVNTNKGASMLERISENLTIRSVDINRVLQEPLKNPCDSDHRRDYFWQLCHGYGVKKAVGFFYGSKYRMKIFVSKVVRAVKKKLFFLNK